MAPIAMAVGLSLLYPLIVLDAVIVYTVLVISALLLTPAYEFAEVRIVFQISTLLLVLSVDAAIIFFAWRSVSRPTRT